MEMELMVRKFAKKSKLIAASSVLLFATAFMPASCSVNLDPALIDQLTGLLNNSNLSGFLSQGPADGNHDGPNHDGMDDSPDTSTGGGSVDATPTGV